MDKFPQLKETILSSYAAKQDVSSIYLKNNSQGISFIVVIEDSTSDSVFEYNEIGFQISGTYQGIEDFMIIDIEEANAFSPLSSYTKIY